MTRETAKKLLPIIQAYADGYKIECRNCVGQWVCPLEPDFDADTEYRVKPDPREWWIYLSNTGSYIVLANASEAAEMAKSKFQVVHVREAV